MQTNKQRVRHFTAINTTQQTTPTEKITIRTVTARRTGACLLLHMHTP